MRCEECLPVIEEYCDGELDEQRKEAIRLHVDNCGSCAAALEDLVKENQIYRCYERDVEVRPELWARVRAGITEEQTASAPREGWRDWVGDLLPGLRTRAWVTAAMMVATIALTMSVMNYVQQPGKDRIPVSTAVNPLEKTPSPDSIQVNKQGPVPEEKSMVLPKLEEGARAKTPGSTDQKRRAITSEIATRARTPDQLVREAEQKYLAAIAMLSRRADHRRGRLDSATLAKLDQALNSIDRTIASTREVVRRHPYDPVAVQYMLIAYSRKIDVLREIIEY